MTLKSARLCGAAREVSALYLEVAESPNGLPVENFLLCPPVRIDLKALGISPIGMHLIEGAGGTRHIADYIGSDYPNTLDLIQEGRLLGFSRRISSTFPFDQLTAESRYLPIHPRGWIVNFKKYFNAEPLGLGDEFKCAHVQQYDIAHPKCASHYLRGLIPEPEDSALRKLANEMCMRLWRQDISEGWAISNETMIGKPLEYMKRFGSRALPCNGSYDALCRPDGVEPEYLPAIIASLPVGRIVGVKAKDGSHKAKMERARKGPFAVQEVEF